MRRLKTKWAGKRFGLQIGPVASCLLTYLRFADDVLLSARTQHQLKIMLEDMCSIAAASGLHVHPEKSKIITNTTRQSGRGRDRNLNIQGLTMEILERAVAVKYLGRKIAFDDGMATEVQNRIRIGWARMMAHKNCCDAFRFVWEFIVDADSFITGSFEKDATKNAKDDFW